MAKRDKDEVFIWQNPGHDGFWCSIDGPKRGAANPIYRAAKVNRAALKFTGYGATPEIAYRSALREARIERRAIDALLRRQGTALARRRRKGKVLKCDSD